MSVRTKPESTNKPVIQPEEQAIIKKCVKNGDVVFDVGAFHGDWAQCVQAANICALHLFEASPKAYSELQSGALSRTTLNHKVVSDSADEVTFHVYRDKPRLSSIYRRKSVETTLMPTGFETFRIPSIRLDDYWPKESGLINFLKIDVEGAEYDVLRGANDLLRRGAIDYIQFEYGGTFLDAGTTLKSVFYYLRKHRYHLFRVSGDTFTGITRFDEKLEDFKYTNYLAVNERHVTRFKRERPRISIYYAELDALGVSVKGVAHIGAHEGKEVEDYKARNINPIILVEPNPEYTARLQAINDANSEVFFVGKAISDRTGAITLNIASSDQSSSILDLKVHAELYPNISYTDSVTVQATTLDECMSDLFPDTCDRKKVNFLAIDIQGAELLALRGGKNTLSHIDAIQLEVNYEELYEGCAIIWELDEFLADHGFIRFKTDTPFDRSWGDALYVRQPIVTNSTIGKLGRFGNQIFQYLFLMCHAKDMGFAFENTPWIGDRLFHVATGVENTKSGLRAITQSEYTTEACDILNSADRLANANLKGFFQYHTSYYKLHRPAILKELSFKGGYAQRAEHILSAFQKRDGIVVGLHLRRGDYGNRFFFLAPTEWYVEWLRKLEEKYPKLTVYLASDEPDKVVSDFDEFDVLTSSDFDQNSHTNLNFFDDFAALTLCNKIAISNSSFSFAATMLNTRADEFMRPDLASKRLIPYDPWNADPLIRSELAEDHGPAFMKAGGK